MSQLLNKRIASALGAIYGSAHPQARANRRPDGGSTIYLRFPVSTHDKLMTPDGDWYEVVFEIDVEHAEPLHGGTDDEVSYQISNLSAAAKRNHEEYSHRLGENLPGGPRKVDGPFSTADL